jgi:hypothetical protein
MEQGTKWRHPMMLCCLWKKQGKNKETKGKNK